METPREYSSDIAFTPAVKSIQSRKGSRQPYARMEEKGSWQTRIAPDLGFRAKPGDLAKPSHHGHWVPPRWRPCWKAWPRGAPDNQPSYLNDRETRAR